MNTCLLSVCAALAVTASVASAQEFTLRHRVAPRSERARPAVEDKSDSSCFTKFMTARNKWQLLNPWAPRQYGSGAQVVVADPQDPQEKPYAVRLFSLAF
jgi:hypothetical protein